MNFILSIFKGIAIGAGAILPGISSGVLCVIFGIYQNLVDSIFNLFKDFKKNFLFLFPLVLGSFIGIILFGNILKYIFFTFNTIARYIFAGFILGCLPSLFKESNFNKYINFSSIILILSSFLLGMLLIHFENYIIAYSLDVNFLYLFICGFLMSIGIIFPGISSTVILIFLGVYYIYLEAISVINLAILVPMALGIFVGALFFLFIMHYLLNNFYMQTFSCIIGFVISSIFILLPTEFSVLGIATFVFAFFISVLFLHIKNKSCTV